MSQSSEASSSFSFEAIDHADTYPPLWVPDFAVTHCMGCYVKFSLGRRKHHCRACGRVYCSDCSENLITLPHEQIFVPSRVCRTCFVKYRPEAQQGGLPVEHMSNGGDQPLATSSGFLKSASVPNTSSVPYLGPPHFPPHQVPGSCSQHTFNQTSTKARVHKCPSKSHEGNNGCSQMNGHGPRAASKQQ